jgi:hypothetical protein
LSPKKVLVFNHTFVGSDIICFTPGFPVKDPKFGVLSSFIHVVATAFEVLPLSSELVSLSHGFFFPHGTIFVSLTK